MLKFLKKMKNNNGGYVLVYVVLLVGFVTILFAGMSMALDGRTKMTSNSVSSQQLQVTAQSALNTIVDEFENNAPLKAKLAEYVQGNGQTAEFELTRDTGITDDITVKITKGEGENKARIEVEARNRTSKNMVSMAYAIVDYGEPPKGESAGVVDNLIVAFLPQNTLQSGAGQNTLCVSGDQFYKKRLEGKIVVNNYGKPQVVINNAGANNCAIESIIASGDIQVKDGNIWAADEDADGKIVSTNGAVTLSNQAAVKGKGINLIAGRNGYRQQTDNFTWENPDVNIITGDKGDVEIKALVGEIGSITSGGKMSITHKETDNLTINGDVIGTKDITWKKTGNNNLITTVKGDILCGEDLKLNVNNHMKVTGDVAAVGSINGGNESSWLELNGVYAGRKIEIKNLNQFVASSLLSGANYRNGDGDKTKNSYISDVTNKGGITLKGSNINISRAVVNDASGSADIDISDKNRIYKRGTSGGFDEKFFSANSTWRNLMLKVEKGSDSNGFVNIAVALQPSEVNPADKLAAFTNAMEPSGGYYATKDGTLVSHHSKYTVGSTNVLDSKIKSQFANLDEEFKQSVPDMEKTPDVVIPQSLKTTWARVTYNGRDEVVINAGGYVQVNCSNCGDNLKMTALDNNTLEVVTFEFNRGADVVFDTTNGKSYDLLVGTRPIEEYENNTDTCYFPFDINVNQPKENPGFVRFFVPDGEKFWAAVDGGATCDIKNIGESAAEGAIPEVYLFYNGTNSLTFKGRYLRGFIVAPHCIVNFQDTPVDWATNKSFEGLIICGNISVANNADGARMVYYKPLTYERAFTTDIYKYN